MIVFKYSFGASSTMIGFAEHTKWLQPMRRKTGKNVSMTSEVKVGAIKTYGWCRMKVDFQIAGFIFFFFY